MACKKSVAGYWTLLWFAPCLQPTIFQHKVTISEVSRVAVSPVGRTRPSVQAPVKRTHSVPAGRARPPSVQAPVKRTHSVPAGRARLPSVQAPVKRTHSVPPQVEPTLKTPKPYLFI